MIHPPSWTIEQSKATLGDIRSIAILHGTAFTAGNSERFNWMIAMLGFTPPYVSTGAQFHPDDFTQAYARGEGASHSFVDTWEFWPELEHQIEDLRRDYQVQPSAEP